MLGYKTSLKRLKRVEVLERMVSERKGIKLDLSKTIVKFGKYLEIKKHL